MARKHIYKVGYIPGHGQHLAVEINDYGWIGAVLPFKARLGATYEGTENDDGVTITVDGKTHFCPWEIYTTLATANDIVRNLSRP